MGVVVLTRSMLRSAIGIDCALRKGRSDAADRTNSGLIEKAPKLWKKSNQF